MEKEAERYGVEMTVKGVKGRRDLNGRVGRVVRSMNMSGS